MCDVPTRPSAYLKHHSHNSHLRQNSTNPTLSNVTHTFQLASQGRCFGHHFYGAGMPALMLAALGVVQDTAGYCGIRVKTDIA